MINWEEIYKLESNEFSEDPDKYADHELIYALSDIRQFTQRKLRPSKASGALARFEGSITSQHYVGSMGYPERKSTASDIFCEGIPFSTYSSIIASRLFKGVGVYLDTYGPDGLPWVMFHVDIRPRGFNQNSPLIWIVEKSEGKNVYKYPQAEPQYWSLLNDKALFRGKKFGVR